MNGIFDTLEYRITNEHEKHKSNPEMLRIISKKVYNEVVDILDKYNTFLLKNGYTDTDIIAEEPTALDEFMSNF